jgi:hypothetical protein
MSGALAPAIALGGISYANQWYNGGSPTDIKPLLYAGIAGLLLEGFGSIPGMAPVAASIGWIAFIGFLISPVQNPSPVQNLVKITGKG